MAANNETVPLEFWFCKDVKQPTMPYIVDDHYINPITGTHYNFVKGLSHVINLSTDKQTGKLVCCEHPHNLIELFEDLKKSPSHFSNGGADGGYNCPACNHNFNNDDTNIIFSMMLHNIEGAQKENDDLVKKLKADA